MAVIHKDITVTPVRVVERAWLTRKEAAKYAGVSVETIRRWNNSALLNYSKVTGLVFIEKNDIDRLLKKNKVFKD